MKKQVKDQVLEFMKDNDTSEMNTNEFVFKFIQTLTWDSILNYTQCIEAPSFESITRSRRWAIKTHWIWKRTKADTQETYIDEFVLNNKIHTWLN